MRTIQQIVIGLLSTVAVFAPVPVRATFAEFWVPLDVELLILKDPALTPYFHLAAGESLIVSRGITHPDLQRQDLGYPITLIEAGTPEFKKSFKFLSFKPTADGAEVKVSYPREGLEAHYWLTRRGDDWAIARRKLTER